MSSANFRPAVFAGKLPVESDYRLGTFFGSTGTAVEYDSQSWIFYPDSNPGEAREVATSDLFFP